jgi:hypothetical protein
MMNEVIKESVMNNVDVDVDSVIRYDKKKDNMSLDHTDVFTTLYEQEQNHHHLQSSRISMNRYDTSFSFGGYSAVTHISTPESIRKQSNNNNNNDDERMVSTTIVDSDIPLSAKRVLLRLGDYEERNGIDNDMNYIFPTEKFDATENTDYISVNDDTRQHEEESNDLNNNGNVTVNTPIAADIEQSRSMSLIQKLRQSAFQRKMNSNTIFHETTGMVDSESMEHNFSTSISPTSVRDRTLSPLPRSILKHRDVNTSVIDDIRSTNDAMDANDASPRTLVVGRVEDGILNLRSPLLKTRTTLSNNFNNNNNTDFLPSNLPESESQVPDSLIISDSSLDGDFDSTSEMITASSILTDTIPTNTSRFENISKTTGIAGSMEFIQQLRGAAFRRKMNISRSRDSLVAKERNHREQIAFQKLQKENEELERTKQQEMVKQQNKTMIAQQKQEQLIIARTRSFKARPLPSTTGLKGSGGLAGVPKVEKRLPTIPKSPYLGQRRVLRSKDVPVPIIQDKDDDDHNNDQQQRQPSDRRVGSSKNQSMNETFKAIPLPKSSSQIGSAGQAGIPKVPKRMVTIPQSPLLGMRRLPVQVNQQQQCPPPSYRKSTPPINTKREAKSTVRIDKTKIRTRDENVADKENYDPIKVVPVTPIVKVSMITPYVPYSTRRAIKRAEFDQRRLINEQIRIEEERIKNQRLVKQLHSELERLRIEI